MKKFNGSMLGLLALSVVATGMIGCANNMPDKSLAKKVAIAKALPAKSKQEVVVVNKPRQTAGAQSNHSKDERHIAYNKKRMLYNQKWLVRQEAEARQKVQRQKYQQQHARNLKQQAQARQQQQSAVQQQPVVVRQQHQNKYKLRQAQIEARQQQNNWRRNGTQVNNTRHVQQQRHAQRRHAKPQSRQKQYSQVVQNTDLAHHLANAAVARTGFRIRYDGRYIPISYPMGDVPANMGVCTDVVIRSYRRLGIDLQRLVHEDMSRAFHAYPNLSKWRLTAPDPNIDHRRVHNLRAFFARNGQRLPATNNPRNYRPGDLVTWSLGGDQGHIGIVVNRRSPNDPNRYMIVHNINSGTKMEDVLFNWPITGHFRYFPGRQPYLASAR